MRMKLSSTIVSGLVNSALDNGTSHLEVCRRLKELEARDGAMIGSSAVSNGESLNVSNGVIKFSRTPKVESEILLANAVWHSEVGPKMVE
ncbi:hypothetical protein FRB95_002168 [Tulasnella sp. JGI-2019a]|nr:hypothetical protein FRB95_002168 [Tulasnella sp. JGI-2019a]